MNRTITAGALALLLCPVAAAGAETPPVCRGKDLTHIAGLAAARAQRIDDLINGDGLLWRIDKPGVAASYLYGTVHSTDDAALAMASRAAKQIVGAKVVATELGGPMDAAEKANMGAAMLARALDRDHDTFDDAPAMDQAEVEKLVAGQGYPTQFAHHLKLWFLAILIAMPQCETKRQALDLPEVDQFLAESARVSGVKVIALETAEEQLDALSAMSPVAAALLAVAARDPARNDDVYATMLKLYRESRPAEILPIADRAGAMSQRERAAADEFIRLLLVGRNATMANRLEAPLKEGGAFVAVGALHLPGKDGLIERLRAEGYTVSKVW